ncbi:MAG: sugar nucleotide-binding protein, partial [Alphaproteobacteria bacterium]|nr:sugar nucleotide-binding protein [Alphaproteobacteria bacterium]
MVPRPRGLVARAARPAQRRPSRPGRQGAGVRRLLITGANGQVGRALAGLAAGDGFEAIALGRDGLDIA